MISAVSATVLRIHEKSCPTHPPKNPPSSSDLRVLAVPRLRVPRTIQTAVPARKLTRFCPTWMRILFTSRTTVLTVAELTPASPSLASTGLWLVVSEALL